MGGRNLFVRSIDTSHNGRIKTGNSEHELDNGKYASVNPGAHQCISFGIPWYGQGKKWKNFSFNQSSGIKVYQSGMSGRNFIFYEDMKTGVTLVKQEVPLH